MAAPRLITVLLLCATLALAKNEALPPVISPVTLRPVCVPVPPVDLAYSCRLDSEDDVSQRVYWVIGDYQAVDRIEFRDFGVLITQNNEETMKGISIAVPTVAASARIDHGTTFLFDYLANSPNPGLNNTLVTISCVSIQYEINILRAEFDIKLYRAVPPVEQPEWEVTSCNSDGSLSLTITYQSIPPADICAGSDVSYSLSLTNDGVCDSLVDDGVVAECQVKDTAGLKATMTACVTVETEDDVCIDTITELTEVTCNRASIIVPCKSGSDGQSVMQARLDCDLVEGASEEWGCTWETGDTVVDLFKEKPISRSQARPVGRPGPGIECSTKDGSRAQLKSLWWWS